MRPRYKVSQAGVDLIEAFEGFRAKSARLDDGRWTIGYGHTRSAREGAEISREDAEILLRWVDLPPVEEAIHALVSVPLTQNQFDALVAFVFNVGVDAFGDSEVLARLNEGRLTEAACALELWRKADIAGDPVVLDALIRRRAAEKALLLAPEAGAAPTPSPLVRPRPDARAAQFVPARRPAEIEAPLAGERAEVRLVAPYEVEPELEAATAFAPESVEQVSVEQESIQQELIEQEPAELESAAQPAPEAEAPTAWTGAAVEPAAEEEAPTAWTVETAEPEMEAALEGAAAPVATVTALAAWAADTVEIGSEPEPAAESEASPTAWTVETPAPETAEAALAAWTADAANEAEPEPAPGVSDAEAEAPEARAAEALDEAPTGWTDKVVEQAAEDFESMTPWAIELPHTASAMLEAQAPASWTAEPAETDLDEPAPSSWIVGVTRPAAPAAEPEPAAAELEATVTELETTVTERETTVTEPETTVTEREPTVTEPPAQPESEVAAAAEAPAAVVTAPDEAPEPDEIVRELPPVGSVLQTRAVPQVSARPRPLYSSYGPMAFAVAPPAATPAETTRASAGEGAVTTAAPPEPEPAPAPAQPEPMPPQPSQATPFQGPAFQASFQRQPHFRPLSELTVPAAAPEPAEPVESFAPPAEAQAPATASAPAVTADAAPAKPLILTSPPADWEEPRAASANPSLAAEADELETPLFDEGWDGPGALSGRIVHHEAPAEHDARATKLGVTGPYVLLGFIGFVAFGGALFAFSRGHAGAGGAGNPVVLAWILALIGAACVGISVYFLLKRLGGQED